MSRILGVVAVAEDDGGQPIAVVQVSSNEL
jgi:hypothetical protein